MKITATKGRIIVLLLGLFGAISLICGSILLGFFEAIVRFFIRKELTLRRGTEFFNIWREVPIPIFQKIYMFNITNPREFSNNAEKPIIKELGPYVYRGRWYKEDIHSNQAEGTITYNDKKEYTFVEELSGGSEDDMIYTINGPLLAVVIFVDNNTPFFFKSVITDVLNGIFESYNSTLLVHRSIKEIIYEGYHEPMVADLVKVVEPFLNLPLKLLNETFGILYEKKHVGDGIFTVKSGENAHDFDEYTSIVRWNNKSHVDWWRDKQCNEIRGTDGVQYNPGLTKDSTIELFNPNLCRTIPLNFEKTVTVHGIKTLRFEIPETVFGSTGDPDSCYCTETYCQPGIMEMSCKKGAPYVISLPHFLDAPLELQNSVSGISPKKDKHKTYVDVEPNTGLVLNAAFKIMLSSSVKRNPSYKVLQNVAEDTLVPVMWMSEEATLDAYFANYFKSRVETPIIVFKVICFAAIIIGGFWTVASAVFLFCIEVKVKPGTLTHSMVLKTLNTVYTNVALWPPVEDEIKEENISEKTHL